MTQSVKCLPRTVYQNSQEKKERKKLGMGLEMVLGLRMLGALDQTPGSAPSNLHDCSQLSVTPFPNNQTPFLDFMGPACV